MTIDANALAEELKVAAETWSEEAKGGLIVAAARELLATLPRFKEVEVVQFAVVSRFGHVLSIWAEEHEATRRLGKGDTIVRLTGTAKVKVSP